MMQADHTLLQQASHCIMALSFFMAGSNKIMIKILAWLGNLTPKWIWFLKIKPPPKDYSKVSSCHPHNGSKFKQRCQSLCAEPIEHHNEKQKWGRRMKCSFSNMEKAAFCSFQEGASSPARVNQHIYSYLPFLEWALLEHLQGCSVCDPALKILHEVQ